MSLTFLTISNSITKQGTFGLYSGIGLLFFVFFYYYLPETKDLPLENIQELFSDLYWGHYGPTSLSSQNSMNSMFDIIDEENDDNNEDNDNNEYNENNEIINHMYDNSDNNDSDYQKQTSETSFNSDDIPIQYSWQKYNNQMKNPNQHRLSLVNNSPINMTTSPINDNQSNSNNKDLLILPTYNPINPNPMIVSDYPDGYYPLLADDDAHDTLNSMVSTSPIKINQRESFSSQPSRSQSQSHSRPRKSFSTSFSELLSDNTSKKINKDRRDSMKAIEPIVLHGNDATMNNNNNSRHSNDSGTSNISL